MSEHARAARGFGSFVGVERPADDDASAMLAKLQQLAERRCESNGQALDERQQAEDARRLLIVKREPALALRVELLLVQGQVVAMQGRIVGLDPVQLQPLLVGKVFRTPPSHSSSLSRKRERIRRCVPFPLIQGRPLGRCGRKQARARIGRGTRRQPLCRSSANACTATTRRVTCVA